MTVKELLIKFLKDKKRKEEPFLSEAQFQHTLANFFLEKGYQIFLETVLLVDEDNDSKKEQKYEVDLILVDKQFKVYVIELKYKTAFKLINNYRDLLNKVELKNQGAQNIASMAFVHDVFRIENIKRQFHQLFNSDKGYSYGGGYAIFLTNVKTYVRDNKKDENSQNGVGTQYARFALTQYKLVNLEGENCTQLKGSYEMHWNEVGLEFQESSGLDLSEYSPDNFYYLLIEI